MKKHKKIIIKNPKLKNLRNNLRKIILESYQNEILKINNEKKEINKKIRERGKISEEDRSKKRELENFKQPLANAFNKSICICYICQKIDKDMVYAMRPGEWFCINCYENKLPKNLLEKWEPKYPLSKEQVVEFLDKLSKVTDQCKTNLDLSMKILAGMGINKRDQDIFLDILYQYGGHCDCEIIMNAYPNIMADFDIDLD